MWKDITNIVIKCLFNTIFLLLGASGFQYQAENNYGSNYVGQCFVKTEAPFSLDKNTLGEIEQKNFLSNEPNDVEDEIDEKPTDYSLRFQVKNCKPVYLWKLFNIAVLFISNHRKVRTPSI